LQESKELIPIVFSHGCHTHRHAYTALCGELASYGYLVISPGHNDGSADFSPYKGHYNKLWVDGEMATRDQYVKLRGEEVNAIVEEIYKPNRFA